MTGSDGVEIGLSRLDTHLIGQVVSINISTGGVPKSRVNGVRVSEWGLEGDTQNDKKHHGGPERAVCLYSLERIVALQAEGHPIDVAPPVRTSRSRG